MATADVADWHETAGGFARVHERGTCVVQIAHDGAEPAEDRVYHWTYRLKGRGYDIGSDPADKYATAELAMEACDQRVAGL